MAYFQLIQPFEPIRVYNNATHILVGKSWGLGLCSSTQQDLSRSVDQHQGPAQHQGQGPAQHQGQGPAQHQGQGPAQHQGQGPAQHQGQGPAQDVDGEKSPRNPSADVLPLWQSHAEYKTVQKFLGIMRNHGLQRMTDKDVSCSQVGHVLKKGFHSPPLEDGKIIVEWRDLVVVVPVHALYLLNLDDENQSEEIIATLVRIQSLEPLKANTWTRGTYVDLKRRVDVQVWKLSNLFGLSAEEFGLCKMIRRNLTSSCFQKQTNEHDQKCIDILKKVSRKVSPERMAAILNVDSSVYHCAAFCSPKLLKTVIDFGADYSRMTPNIKGYSALQYMCSDKSFNTYPDLEKRKQSIRILLCKFPNNDALRKFINMQAKDGTTALHQCVLNQQTELAQLLIDFGADPGQWNMKYEK